MSEYIVRARRYRDRAAELRKLAAAIEEAEGRRTMERLADEYDRMANAEEAKSAASGHPNRLTLQS